MENAPPETHALIRKKSVFDLVGSHQKPKQKKRKTNWFEKVVKKVKNFRTFLAAVFLLVYLFFGASMFLYVEEDSAKIIEDYEKKLLKKARELYEELLPSMCPPLKKSDTLKSNTCLKEIYTQLYDINPPNKNIVSFWDGLNYVITCLTTIGYGNLVCYTTAGKMLTVIYGLFGIALLLYVLRNNGKLALKCCNKLISWFWALVYSCCPCGERDYRTQSRMTVGKAIVILIIFWTFGALAIALFEAFSFEDAIYFSFSTFSTIGFGDFVPTSHVSAGIIFTLHFIDLSLLSMIFALVHESMENNFMVVLELLDEGYRRHTATMELHMASPIASKQMNTTTALEKSQTPP